MAAGAQIGVAPAAHLYSVGPLELVDGTSISRVWKKSGSSSVVVEGLYRDRGGVAGGCCCREVLSARVLVSHLRVYRFWSKPRQSRNHCQGVVSH